MQGVKWLACWVDEKERIRFVREPDCRVFLLDRGLRHAFSFHQTATGESCRGNRKIDQLRQRLFADLPGAASIDCFEGIAIYLRTVNEDKKESFTLYCNASTPFSDQHRDRLTAHGVQFIYMSSDQQAQYHDQIESRLMQVVDDETLAISVKAEIVYETCVELMNQMLADPQQFSGSTRLAKVSYAITKLIQGSPGVFSALFAASHHDFYTGTHVVNVATWMTCLAHSMKKYDEEQLNQICQAGLLHDVGKMFIPPKILNKRTTLSDEDWKQIQLHPKTARGFPDEMPRHSAPGTAGDDRTSRADGRQRLSVWAQG